VAGGCVSASLLQLWLLPGSDGQHAYSAVQMPRALGSTLFPLSIFLLLFLLQYLVLFFSHFLLRPTKNNFREILNI
jgi:hypothetical protein